MEPDDRRKAQQLITMRIIWGALLMGPLMFLVVILILFRQGSGLNAGFNVQLFQMVCVAAVAGAVVMSYIVRKVIYGAANESGAIAMAKYSSGNIVFWALNEGAAFFALVCMLLHGQALPFLALALIPMANNLVNFPSGAPVEGRK